MSESQVKVQIAEDDQIPNKDFIFRYDVAGEKPEYALLTTCENGEGYFMLMIQPQAKFSVSEITPKEMYFVIDCSGSMSGFPIEKAKEAVKLAIENMHPDDYFQIIRFSSSASGFAPNPVPNTPEHVRKAMDYIDNLSGGGGTYMIEGIKKSLDGPRDSERRRIVLFMTDGYIGNEGQILAAIEERLGNARLYSFGVGSSVNRYLLDRMAKVGKGYVTYCRQDENPRSKIRLFAERIAKPYMLDIEVDWNGLEIEELIPDDIPDLFAGQPVTVFGRYTEPGEAVIKIKGNIRNKQIVQRIPVKLPENEPANDVISTIWARRKIEHLMSQMYNGEDPETVEQVTGIALKYRLMSNYTSFVAVDEEVRNPEKVLETLQIPVELPDGVSYEGVFGSAGEMPEDSSIELEDSDTDVGFGSIKGKIRFNNSGLPIQGAAVKLLQDGQLTGIGMFSNTDGRFVISNVPQGIYDVEVVLKKCRTVLVYGVEVKVNEITDLESIEIAGYGSITGTVVDKDNRPIMNANVEVVLNESRVGKIYSSKDGSFTFKELVPGYYKLEISAPVRKVVSLKDIKVSLARTTIIKPVVLEIVEPESEYSNTGSTNGALKGQVKDQSTGNPLGLVAVQLKTKDGGTAAYTYADGNGKFFISNIIPGVYDVELFLMGYQSTVITDLKITSGKTTQISPKMSTGAAIRITGVTISKKDLLTGPGSQSRTGEEISRIAGVGKINNIVILEPGTVNSGSGIHVQGSRSNQLVTMVDGINDNDPVTKIVTASPETDLEISFEPPVVYGILTLEEVCQVFEKMRLKLVEENLKLLKKLLIEGRFVIGMTVLADGSVTDIWIKSSTVKNEELEKILTEELSGLQFSPNSEESVISVAWLFTS